MAAITDKITGTRSGSSNAVPTTVSSTRSIGGTSLSCVDLTGWPTATAVHFITYKKKSDGSIDRSTQCDWKGIVSGTTIGSLTLKNGTDAGNAVGDFVEMAPTGAFMQDLVDGVSASLAADGTLKANTVDTTQIKAGAVTTSTLAESVFSKTTDANGWTVYSYANKNIEYTKTFTIPSQSISTGGQILTLTGNNLPAGMSSIGDGFIHYSLMFAAGSPFIVSNLDGDTTATSIKIGVSRTTSSATLSGQAYVYVRET